MLGCAAVKPLGNAEGAEVAELSAFCVHPAYRGGGKGDSLLEYLGAFPAGVPDWHGCCWSAWRCSATACSATGDSCLSGCAVLLGGCAVCRALLHCPSPFVFPPAEADAAQQGIQRLVLLTTRTADWFEQRGFRHAGAAHLSALLPEARRQRVDPSRNSQLFSKPLAPRKG